MSFYTYGHYTESGVLFYIGKGQKARAFDKTGRSDYWKSVSKKHGLKVEMFAQWETEQEAFDHERFLISCFRDDLKLKLCNFTDGGEGASGCKHVGENWDKHFEALARINSNLTFEDRSKAIKCYFSKFQKYESPQAKQFLKMSKDPVINQIRSVKSTEANLVNWQDEAVRQRRIEGMTGKKKTMSPEALQQRKNASLKSAETRKRKLISH